MDTERDLLQQRNILYRDPALYEATYPDPNFARGNMCLEQFKRHLGAYPRTVLDIGCGTGRDVEMLVRHGIECTGIDPSAEMIAYARERTTATFDVSTIQALSLDQTFDAILILGNVLSHLVSREDLANGLDAVRQHARPGTLLIASVLNYGALLASGVVAKPRHFHPGPEYHGLQATATYRIDNRCQLLHRKRIWHRDGADVTTDTSTHRMIFAEEFRQLFSCIGCDLLDMADNEAFEPSAFSGDEITFVGRFRSGCDLEHESETNASRSSSFHSCVTLHK